MKKLPVIVISVLVFAVCFVGYAFAQEDTDPAAEDAYTGEENPPDPAVTDEDMWMFSEEAIQETGSAEAENLEADTTESEETEEETEGGEEIVATYSEEDSQLETEECTLWSCALYKMIVSVVGIGASAFWIFMLVDILKLDSGVFPPGHAYRKWLWFAGVFFFWAIGAAIYYFEIFKKQHEAGGSSAKK